MAMTHLNSSLTSLKNTVISPSPNQLICVDGNLNVDNMSFD